MGKWVSISAENIDAFMKEMHVNFLLRKIAAYTTTYFEISEKGDGYVLRWRVAILSGSQVFYLNEEFTHDLPDGRTVLVKSFVYFRKTFFRFLNNILINFTEFSDCGRKCLGLETIWQALRRDISKIYR